MTRIVREAEPEIVASGLAVFDVAIFDPMIFDTGGRFERENEPPTAAIDEE